MKKALTLPLLIFLSCLIAGMYGILHDQVTYTISPEYYTKFKFYQFGLAEFGMPESNPRLLVCVVGWMATWWVGLFLGIILSIIGLIHKTWKIMFTVTLKAVLINLGVAALSGIIGYCYSLFFTVPNDEYMATLNLPFRIDDSLNFIRVGCIHIFGYIGALIGLIIAIIYTIKSKKKIPYPLPPAL